MMGFSLLYAKDKGLSVDAGLIEKKRTANDLRSLALCRKFVTPRPLCK
jgi:hypothetical protein